MAAALTETASAMGGLRASASAEDAAAAHASFEHLQEVTVAHLDHEEAEIEPVCWRRRTAPSSRRWAGRSARVRRRGPAGYLAWLADGAGAEETGRDLGATMPTPVLR